MRYLLTVTSILYANLIGAQSVVWAPDSILQEEPAYVVNRYHNMLRYHEPLMYLAVPYITNIVERKRPLQDGEGKNGAIAEGHFGYRFVIYKGKYYNREFFQRLRATFDVSLLLRLANDHSLPLLPTNNKFGLGLDFLLSKPGKLLQETTVPVWLTAQLHHYSNGQAGDFFINDAVQRNNYIGGDFSTNYFRTTLNIARLNGQKSLFSTMIGYQYDVDPGGPLERSKELEKYYGRQRALLSFQWVVRSRIFTTHSPDRTKPGADEIEIKKRHQFCFRTEFEYITDDVSRFERNNKYRLGWHTYTTFMPSVTNEVGFMIHTYLGRDYLNIRFDDIVFTGAAGICVKFNSR